jgi:RNA recognition motif-containing protein
MENSSVKKLICRKCSGDHLTIKCGKDNKPIENNSINKSNISNNKTIVANNNISNNNISNNNTSNNKNFKQYEKKEFIKHDNSNRRPLHKIKMSNLPTDMTDEELQELLYEWGHVIRLRVLNYQDNSTAYIEFKTEEEAEYLVKALHKTPFESILLDVSRIYE